MCGAEVVPGGRVAVRSDDQPVGESGQPQQQVAPVGAERSPVELGHGRLIRGDEVPDLRRKRSVAPAKDAGMWDDVVYDAKAQFRVERLARVRCVEENGAVVCGAQHVFHEPAAETATGVPVRDQQHTDHPNAGRNLGVEHGPGQPAVRVIDPVAAAELQQEAPLGALPAPITTFGQIEAGREVPHIEAAHVCGPSIDVR